MPKKRQYKKLTERELIRREAEVGSTLFGKLPSGHRREFFCLDERTWVWHEEWKDQTGKQHIRTTRYDLRPQGIFKAQNSQRYQPVTRQEADHLYAAALRYRDMVQSELLS